VIFWRLKQGLVIAAVTVLGLFGGFLGLGDLLCGFYW
jgi:hypothetical protein